MNTTTPLTLSHVLELRSALVRYHRLSPEELRILCNVSGDTLKAAVAAGLLVLAPAQRFGTPRYQAGPKLNEEWKE